MTMQTNPEKPITSNLYRGSWTVFCPVIWEYNFSFQVHYSAQKDVLQTNGIYKSTKLFI